MDLLVEGVKSLAEASVVNDLWDTYPLVQRYRPPTQLGVASSSYDHWDMPSVDGNNVPPEDAWLASRYPDRRSIFATVDPITTGTGTNPIQWRSITAPLCSPTGTTGGYVFETPCPIRSGPGPIYTNLGTRSAQRTFMIPTLFQITYPNNTIITYPGLQPTYRKRPDRRRC